MQRLDVESAHHDAENAPASETSGERLRRIVASMLPQRWRRDRDGFSRLQQEEAQDSDVPTRPSGMAPTYRLNPRNLAFSHAEVT